MPDVRVWIRVFVYGHLTFAHHLTSTSLMNDR